MTDQQITDMASKHCQYADTRQLTLRGQAVIDFARDVIEAERLYVRDGVRCAGDLLKSAGEILEKVA